MTDKLPLKLPRHAGRLAVEGYRFGRVVFTAEQMHEFAEEAVKQERERCLAAIEAVEEPAYHGYENPNTFNDGKWAAMAAIRGDSALSRMHETDVQLGEGP
jgi:hypothetical protein